jgi:hypothetical protein
MASLVYFLVAAAALGVRLKDGRELFTGLHISTTFEDKDKPSAPERVGVATNEAP